MEDVVTAAIGGWLWMTAFGLVTLLYWTPTVVGAVRQMPNTGSIALLNGLAGWTLFGWVMAFTMAGAHKPAPVTA
jgi:Superinfection immunity protein